jgi:hypothetical protein
MPVLLVEADAEERIRFGTWLEEAGFDLLTCPGPVEPDYTCIGGRTGACPLAAEASIVVLDMSLDSEVVMGTAAEDLLDTALRTPGGRSGSRGGEEIPVSSSASTHPRHDELLGAVQSLADAGEAYPGSVLQFDEEASFGTIPRIAPRAVAPVQSRKPRAASGRRTG